MNLLLIVIVLIGFENRVGEFFGSPVEVLVFLGDAGYFDFNEVAGGGEGWQELSRVRGGVDEVGDGIVFEGVLDSLVHIISI